MFAEAWCVDFEYRAAPGEHPFVVCMVGRELHSGREIRLWRGELLAMHRPPFDLDRAVVVAFYASAEVSCFLELGWPLPRNLIDLYIEHRVQTNGLPRPKPERKETTATSGKVQKGDGRDSLLGALALRGLGHIDVDDKVRLRELILTESNPSESQRAEILNYCASDVVGTEALLCYMLDRRQIDWPRALWRGRYAIAAAKMERTGTPVDLPLHRRLAAAWPALRRALIADVDRSYGVFDEAGTFKTDRFRALVTANNWPWPTLPSGALELSDDVFDEMARFHPELRPLYELRSSLGKMRLTGLAIGADARNRCLLSMFQAVTGRNQPSNSRFIFGPSRWMRGLIKPPPDRGLAYCDWETQEIAIAAALSGDERLIADYATGDIYLAFARAAGLVPPDATAESHREIRERCKVIVLGIGYGMTADGMAIRAGITRAEARSLLDVHRHTYKKFWQWTEDAVATGLFDGEMQTKFGWRRQITSNPNARSLQNWNAQSHGAEMMRAAAIAATEVGIAVCCPVHDAFLIEAPVDRLAADVAAMRAIMSAAGEAVIGMAVRTDAKTVPPPDRYMDKRGAAMWDRVMGLLQQVEEQTNGEFRLGQHQGDGARNHGLAAE
jgi:DNA polymerase-1